MLNAPSKMRHDKFQEPFDAPGQAARAASLSSSATSSSPPASDSDDESSGGSDERSDEDTYLAFDEASVWLDTDWNGVRITRADVALTYNSDDDSVASAGDFGYPEAFKSYYEWNEWGAEADKYFDKIDAELEEGESSSESSGVESDSDNDVEVPRRRKKADDDEEKVQNLEQMRAAHQAAAAASVVKDDSEDEVVRHRARLGSMGVAVLDESDLDGPSSSDARESSAIFSSAAMVLPDWDESGERGATVMMSDGSEEEEDFDLERELAKTGLGDRVARDDDGDDDSPVGRDAFSGRRRDGFARGGGRKDEFAVRDRRGGLAIEREVSGYEKHRFADEEDFAGDKASDFAGNSGRDSRRDESSRDESRRDNSRRDESRRDDSRRNDHIHDGSRRDESRRDRDQAAERKGDRGRDQAETRNGSAEGLAGRSHGELPSWRDGVDSSDQTSLLMSAPPVLSKPIRRQRPSAVPELPPSPGTSPVHSSMNGDKVFSLSEAPLAASPIATRPTHSAAEHSVELPESKPETNTRKGETPFGHGPLADRVASVPNPVEERIVRERCGNDGLVEGASVSRLECSRCITLRDKLGAVVADIGTTQCSSAMAAAEGAGDASADFKENADLHAEVVKLRLVLDTVARMVLEHAYSVRDEADGSGMVKNESAESAIPDDESDDGDLC